MHNRDNYINSPIHIEAELLLLLQKENVKIVFDIGACEAEDSIRYSFLFPHSTIHAFEPHKDNVRLGQEFIKKYNRTNIILTNIALSKENGTADFFLSEGKPKEATDQTNWDYGNKSSSLLPPSDELKVHTPWLKFNHKISVNTLRLDTYATQHSIEEIDFIHMDVQGAELMVLEGAGDFIKKIKLIWMEVEAVELYKNQPLKNDVEHYMKHHDFIKVLDTIIGISGDQLYVNKHYFSKKEIKKIRSLKNKPGFFQKIKSFLCRQ